MDAATTPLRSKSARLAAWFVLFCALTLVAAQCLQLGLCSDARHAVLRELVSSPEPATVVFVGSSQTARGVIPDVFDARAAELGVPVRSVNLSFFGTSRQLAYLTLERWLDAHPDTTCAYVECGVLSDNQDFPHEALSRFETPSDALSLVVSLPYDVRNAREFKRRKDHPPTFDPLGAFTRIERFQLHAELSLEALGRGPEDCVRALFNLAQRRGASPYWMPNEPTLASVIDAQVAERGYYRITPDSPLGLGGKAGVTKQAAAVSYETALAATFKDLDDFSEPTRFRATKLYAERIAALCKARGVRLVFLDQPNFRGRPLRPSQVAFYSQLAELFQQDKSVLYREESFQDSGHLSVMGAEFASKALATQFVGAGKQ
jgi:hypothetical protein